MNLSKWTLIACGLLTLNACSFNRKNVDNKIRNSEVLLEQSKQSLNEQKAALITKDDVKIQFIPESAPNVYSLEIKWPAGVPKVEITTGAQKISLGSKNSVHKIEVYGGETIKFQLRTLTSDGLMMSNLDFTEVVPKDYAINGYTKLNSNLEIGPEYNRVIFTENSLLNLNGYNLSILTNQIVFKDQSRITTIKPKTKEAISSNPTLINEGVKIQMEAQLAMGMVHIYMIGVDGADGKDSWQLAYELYNKDIKVPAENGVMGAPGLEQPGRCTTNKAGAEICRPSLCRGATAGTDGQDGLRAPDAQDGFNGGSPGQIKILIDDYSQAAFRIYEKAGRPGKGGQGHASQQGGRGGEKHPQSCLEGDARGKDGITPPAGRDGEDGREANSLIAEIPRDPAYFMIQTLNEKNNPFSLFSTENISFSAGADRQ